MAPQTELIVWNSIYPSLANIRKEGNTPVANIQAVQSKVTQQPVSSEAKQVVVDLIRTTLDSAKL